MLVMITQISAIGATRSRRVVHRIQPVAALAASPDIDATMIPMGTAWL